MAEDNEDEIEDWYFNHQDKDLMTYLCANRVLRKDDKSEIFNMNLYTCYIHYDNPHLSI